MSLQRMLEKRTSRTLVHWLRELNSWRWPEKIPDPESPDEPNHPRRRDVMQEITHVLGWRFARQFPPKDRK